MVLASGLSAQELDLEEIMQGYQWVGHSPQNPRWDHFKPILYFDWNPEFNPGDSLYFLSVQDTVPKPVPLEELRSLPTSTPVLNQENDKMLYLRYGDLYLKDLNHGQVIPILATLDDVTDPHFSLDGQQIQYTTRQNLYSWNSNTGQTTQLTWFVKGSEPKKSEVSKADEWLKRDQLGLFQVLSKKAHEDTLKSRREKLIKPSRPKKVYLGKAEVGNIHLDPGGQFITYVLETSQQAPSTAVMHYVTPEGYAISKNARAKVGNLGALYTFNIYHIEKDTFYQPDLQSLPGIKDSIDYSTGQRYPASKLREVNFKGPYYSDDGAKALLQIRSADNKDRWLCLLQLSTGYLELLDHQTDPAWIQGPGIGYQFQESALGWYGDNRTIWFQSEMSGYSHLYSLDTETKRLKALTSGEYEIYDPQLSRDKSRWYFSSNQVHPGERHFYTMSLNGENISQLTHMPGRNDVSLSPDEQYMAILNSRANQPWELYLQPTGSEQAPTRITYSQTEEFKAYPWREPQYITFLARDGAQVHGRLYQPAESERNGAGIIFVHGAGYLQNAHQWWSGYYREYMFHNYLADRGYTVLDIDYRGSAGYGRDVRTGIYQFMGGQDLTDNIDGANYLVDTHDIDADRLGIYGGSYGGFITLMAMFTQPEVFAAGAALRSVTDWAHYNHPYTSNILNTPVEDSTAFRRSSPIYHAENLQGALLMLHGMVDSNVQFQDIVRLSQRLIELKKENWELAVYPVEGHGFQESSSWYDEYRRIYKLFDTHLSKK